MKIIESVSQYTLCAYLYFHVIIFLGECKQPLWERNSVCNDSVVFWVLVVIIPLMPSELAESIPMYSLVREQPKLVQCSFIYFIDSGTCEPGIFSQQLDRISFQIALSFQIKNRSRCSNSRSNETNQEKNITRVSSDL